MIGHPDPFVEEDAAHYSQPVEITVPKCEACEQPRHLLNESDGCAWHEYLNALEDWRGVDAYSWPSRRRVEKRYRVVQKEN